MSAVEVCRAAIERIERTNPALNAFNLVAAKRALERAEAIDRQRAAGATPGPLAGVPVALKDNLCVRGMRTTASSRILDTFVAPYDATVVQRLEAAGAVIVGKTNCDEFAMGSSNENSAYGPVRNPWAADRTPGGIERRLRRSGRRAVRAARARLRYRRIDPPASVVLRRRRAQADLRPCVALRPAGVRLVARSDRSVHTIGRRCGRGAVGAVRPGSDGLDLVAEAVPDFTAALTGDVKGVRVGVPRAFVAEGVDDAVRRAFDEALDVLRRCRRDAGRHRPPPRAVRDPGLLPGLHGRGELEPRPLRRREVRLPLAGREGRQPDGDVQPDA